VFGIKPELINLNYTIILKFNQTKVPFACSQDVIKIKTKMKKGITMFLAGLLLGIVVTLVVLMVVLPKQMFIVNESKLDFDATVETITQSVKENEWSMPHQYDLQATMKKHGFDVNPVKVFSLCKPEHAYKILNSDDERLVSALMPCRVAVYEKGGKTYVSMLNSGLFSKFMGKKVKDVMGAATTENKEILAPVIK
jgi:uncharacterized protein (DUF302 family)